MRVLNNLSVRCKLWGLTAVLVGGLSVVSAISQYREVQASDAALVQARSYDARIADSIEWRGLTDTNIQRVIAMAISKDPAIKSNFQEKIPDTIKSITEVQKRVTAEATSDADKRQLAEVANKRSIVLAAVKKGTQINLTGSADDAQAFVSKEVNPSVAGYMTSLEEFGKLQVAERDASAMSVETDRGHEQRLQLALVAALTLLALFFAGAVVRSVCTPLQEAVQLSTSIAAGDLSCDIVTSREDELGQMLRSMGAMVVHLRSIVNEVRGGVDAVSTASSQIAMGNVNLSQRTEEQAGSLQETAASMEQLTSPSSSTLTTQRLYPRLLPVRPKPQSEAAKPCEASSRL